MQRECTFLICKFTSQTTNNSILYLFVNSSQRRSTRWNCIACCCFITFFLLLLRFSCLFYSRYIFTHALYVCYIVFVFVADCKLFSLFLFYIFHLASSCYVFVLIFILFSFAFHLFFMRKLDFHLHEKCLCWFRCWLMIMFSFCYFSVRIKIQCYSQRTINILHFNTFFPIFFVHWNILYYSCGRSFAAIFCMYSLMYILHCLCHWILNGEYKYKCSVEKKKEKTRKMKRTFKTLENKRKYWKSNDENERDLKFDRATTIFNQFTHNLFDSLKWFTLFRSLFLILFLSFRWFYCGCCCFCCLFFFLFFISVHFEHFCWTVCAV